MRCNSETTFNNEQLPAHITGEEGLKDVRIMQAIYERPEQEINPVAITFAFTRCCFMY